MIGGTLLRIFLDEDARAHGKPLYTHIVETMQNAGFGGATVLKGIEGFGRERTVHSGRTADFSTHLPVLIEVFDAQEKIHAFIPQLRSMLQEGLITLENVQLLRVTEE
jgi:PII-like signaling protein